MIFNYIIKSEIGIKLNTNGELFTEVEKSSTSSPVDAMKIYKEHLEHKLLPCISKRDGRVWNNSGRTSKRYFEE